MLSVMFLSVKLSKQVAAEWIEVLKSFAFERGMELEKVAAEAVVGIQGVFTSERR